MYIAQKKRKNRHDEMVYYFYKAESVRVDGKVKNTQKYMTNFRMTDLDDEDAFEERLDELREKFGHEAVSKMLLKIEELK